MPENSLDVTDVRTIYKINIISICCFVSFSILITCIYSDFVVTLTYIISMAAHEFLSGNITFVIDMMIEYAHLKVRRHRIGVQQIGRT